MLPGTLNDRLFGMFADLARSISGRPGREFAARTLSVLGTPGASVSAVGGADASAPTDVTSLTASGEDDVLLECESEVYVKFGTSVAVAASPADFQFHMFGGANRMIHLPPRLTHVAVYGVGFAARVQLTSMNG